MKVLFDYQDILKVIKNGVTPLARNVTEAQQATHKEEKKKDYKVLFLIHQCVNGDNFEKVGHCDSSKFYNIVVEIEESKDLTKISKEELQSSLEAHEQRIHERNNDKAEAEISLQARFNEKDNRSKGKCYNKHGGHGTYRGERKWFDKSKKQCYKCQRSSKNVEKLSCGRLDDMIDRLHEEEDAIISMKGVQRSEECIGDVLIMRRDGGYSLIKCVFYIPGNECNLLSIGQFLKKDYKIHMENKGLRILDENGVLVLKAPMDANRTFKVELKVMEHRYLATTSSRD
ncbi:uncharacterized protein LOC127103470 [Lathyrus oleraceus]|uniref:uncharacterized protein LOC127103470 n=1 Tax=Pisum sativum TaxID=3888 RepID=UPI0021CFF915|nr:uncharacterized protein LOC127103470 [Pisum sativum]